jgi:hypothetical protein
VLEPDCRCEGSTPLVLTGIWALEMDSDVTRIRLDTPDLAPAAPCDSDNSDSDKCSGEPDSDSAAKLEPLGGWQGESRT